MRKGRVGSVPLGISFVFSWAVAALSFAQDPQPAPASLKAQREALAQEVAAMLEQGDYGRLEQMARELRESRARFTSGDWKLETFYAGVRTGRGHITLQSVPQYFAALERWSAEFSDSTVPRIALANAHRFLGWQARGTGYASTVSESGAAEFEDHFDIAWDLLRVAEKEHPRDPFLYQMLVEVGRASGKPRAEVDAYFKKGMEIEHAYYPLYTTRAHYLLPRWGGVDGGVEAFATGVADANAAAGEGDVLYAKVAWYLLHETGEEELDRHGFGWPRVQSGFALLARRFPDSAFNRNALCRLACYFKDKKTAAVLFAQLGESWDDDKASVWHTPAEYAQWQEWVHGQEEDARGALLQAAGHGDVARMRELLARGAAIDEQDPDGTTPLLNALLQHESAAAAFLLEAGADPKISTHKGWTPLHEAVDNDDRELVSALLHHGADVNAAVSGPKWTPLHLAARAGFADIATILLAQKELDVNALLRNGDTALVQAIRSGHVEVVKLLAPRAGVKIEPQ